MRILVTGGAGYIGSQTARLLSKRGHTVVSLDDLSNGRRAALAGLPLTTGDIRDTDLVERVIRDHGVEGVMHFAASKSVEASMGDPGAYFDVNVGGTLSVLRAMVRCDVRSFVLSSTCAVYGPPATLPVAEDAPLQPASPYGESKLLAERLLPWFEEAHGVRSAVLRYFNAAGAALDGSSGEDWRDAVNLVPMVLGVAAGRMPALMVNGTDLPTPDGTAVRDFVHVVDLATAHLRALEVISERDASMTLNVGTGHGSSVLEVVDAARRITGHAIPIVPGPPRPGDAPAIWADTSAAEVELGWHASYDLEDMIASAWAWHRTHPFGHAATALAS